VAAEELRLTQIAAVIRSAGHAGAADRVANCRQLGGTRRQLMLDRGLTEQAAADVLCWSINRVVARVKLLQLPERAQQMIGAGAVGLIGGRFAA
jgi:ParB-like chromosome segregation protein Spo0J